MPAKQRIIGIADLAASADPDEQMVAYSLGSCIGVALYDPVAKVGGLLHFMLPDSRMDRKRAEARPGLFADSGIPTLLKTAAKLGLEPKRSRILAVGGAQVLDAPPSLRVGERNFEVLRKILEDLSLSLDTADVGGTQNRTLFLEVGSGKAGVRAAGGEVKYL